MFAKPFLGSLDGHKDGISCLGKHPQRLSVMLSGACDGEVNVTTYDVVHFVIVIVSVNVHVLVFSCGNVVVILSNISTGSNLIFSNIFCIYYVSGWLRQYGRFWLVLLLESMRLRCSVWTMKWMMKDKMKRVSLN